MDNLLITFYPGLKHAHIGFVALSYGLFVLRGVLAIRGTYQPTRLTNIVIHGVDTLLLVCGVSLAFMLQLNPLTTPWLMAKLVALVAYVLVAAALLRRGRCRATRLVGWLLAQLIFLYMVLVALTRNPLLIL